MIEFNSKRYSFFVNDVEYKNLESAEDAVEELYAGDYNNIDYRNEFSDEFFSNCEDDICIYDEENNLLYYAEFCSIYY